MDDFVRDKLSNINLNFSKRTGYRYEGLEVEWILAIAKVISELIKGCRKPAASLYEDVQDSKGTFLGMLKRRWIKSQIRKAVGNRYLGELQSSEMKELTEAIYDEALAASKKDFINFCIKLDPVK